MDENNRIRIQDPDPFVRGMDPWIRIHTKMSWIRNTAVHAVAVAARGAGEQLKNIPELL